MVGPLEGGGVKYPEPLSKQTLFLLKEIRRKQYEPLRSKGGGPRPYWFDH